MSTKKITLSDEEFIKTMENLTVSNPDLLEHEDGTYSIVIGDLIIQFVDATSEAIGLINIRKTRGTN